jgi:MFS family permease
VSEQSDGADSIATPPAARAAEAAATRMLAVNARKVVLLGTAAFFIAFLVLLPFWSWLSDHGHRVWLWTALAGWILGLAALPLIGKHSSEGRLG